MLEFKDMIDSLSLHGLYMELEYQQTLTDRDRTREIEYIQNRIKELEKMNGCLTRGRFQCPYIEIWLIGDSTELYCTNRGVTISVSDCKACIIDMSRINKPIHPQQWIRRIS